VIPEANKPRKAARLDMEIVAAGRLQQALAVL
jgi:hypothetical protein